MKTADDFFIIGIPSIDTRIDLYAMNTIGDVPYAMHKSKILASSDKIGIFETRNIIKNKIAEALDKIGVEHGDVIRMLWLDSDIKIYTASDKVAAEFVEADKNHWNMIGEYHALWTNQQIVSTLCRPNDTGSYTTLVSDELKKYENYEPLPRGYVGGLGFYYGDFDLRYNFNMHDFGEDVNFFKYMYNTYPDYKLTKSKVALGHIKQMII